MLRSVGREVKSVRKRNCRFARRHIGDGFIVEACNERTAWIVWCDVAV